MASPKFISTCMRMFFIVNFHIYVSAEKIGGNVDLTLAMQKIDELQKIVSTQDGRISILEKRPTEESEVQSLTELQSIVKKQGDKIAQLEARIQELETVVKVERVIPVEPLGNGQLSERNGISVTSNKTYSRRGRLLHIQPTTVPVDMVAFYAYLSTDIPASLAHHIIAFDKVVTNVGNAYHPHSGTFIASRTGVYVFTWTIRLYGNSYFQTELLVNNNVVNWIYFNPNNSVQGSVSGTSVVHVDQGDDVLIRTGSSYHSGDIISDSIGKSSFAGWILM